MHDEVSWPIHEAVLKDGNRENTLARALISRETDTILALLEAGADVSYGGNLNAIARAEWKGHADVAALLRERGAAEPAGNAEHDGIPDDFLPQLRWRFGSYTYAEAILTRYNGARNKKGN